MNKEIANSAIALAVEPLRTEAMQKAKAFAEETLVKMVAKLEESGWDLNIAAPYPRSGIGRPNYMAMKARRDLFLRLFDQSPNNSMISNSPMFLVRDEKAESRFVEMAMENASAEFDAYVVKLVGKVGEHSKASVTGSLWSFSVLTVETPEGEQRWKTQQILNVSKLQKLFNQYPTRKMK